MRSLLVGAALAAAPVSAQAPDIVDTLAGLNRFQTLVSAVQAADLVDDLKSPGPFTVFAPTDEAFAALPPEVLNRLLGNTSELTALLTYHVVPGQLLAVDVLSQPSADTLLGQSVAFSANDSGAFVNNSLIVLTDLQTSNGVIHVIDTVLKPDFEALPKTLVELLASNPQFSTLVTAVDAAGLVPVLNGFGPFTIFAPTNRAFDKLPPGTLQSLLADIPALTEILTYHVLGGEFFAADVISLPGATTLLGQDLTFSVGPGGVFVDAAEVLVTDIVGFNGVLHAIDEVLIPAP